MYVFPNFHGTIYLSGELPENLQQNPSVRRAIHTYNRGVQQVKKGNYVKALFLFQGAVKQNPELAQGWNNLAWLACIRGDYKAAIAYRRKAVSLDPLKTVYRANLITDLYISAGLDPVNNVQPGQEYMQRRTDWQITEAQREVGWFMQHQPKSAVTWILQGEVYEVKGDLNSAKMSYIYAIGLDPHLAAAHAMLAGVCLTEDDYADLPYHTGAGELHDTNALFELNRAHDLDPNEPNANFMMAKLQALKGNQADAASLLRDAIRADPTFKTNILGPNADPVFAQDPVYRAVAMAQ